jgi:CheY-like chemotaxis protein
MIPADKAIFLVDDEPAHRQLFKRALKKAGIANPVIEAGSLSEGMKIIQDFLCKQTDAPLVAVVDLNLVDGRGTDIVAALRACEPTKEVPVLVLSTSALEKDMEESFANGASGYLTKCENIETYSKSVMDSLSSLVSAP